MTNNEEKVRIAEDHNLTDEQLVKMAMDLRNQGYSKESIARILCLDANKLSVLVGRELRKKVRQLKEGGKLNSEILKELNISENMIRVILNPKPEITETMIIWFPGIYEGRTDDEYTQLASSLEEDDLVRLVQKRAREDGEWAIENGLVGDNEDKMRKMMEWVSDPNNIGQCLQANLDQGPSVDWICRDLANGSKWLFGSHG